MPRLKSIGIWGACALSLASGSAYAQTLEYSVKANYLVRFAAFVTWDEGAFAHARAPLVICLAGQDPFGGSLERASASQAANGHPIIVRRLGVTEDVSGCHILYQGARSGVAASRLENRSGLLIVTDEATSQQRGMIHFVLASGRVRFHIDQNLARQNELSISSRLLNLALSVRGG